MGALTGRAADRATAGVSLTPLERAYTLRAEPRSFRPRRVDVSAPAGDDRLRNLAAPLGPSFLISVFDP